MTGRESLTRFTPFVGALLVLVLAFLAVIWRIDRAPDIFTDEILYTRAGIRVANEGALVWDDSDPLFVHPPLYFLTEAAYLKLTTDTSSVMHVPGDIFNWVYFARLMNALFAAWTAALLYWLGHRLRGPALGALLAALFILDPFGLRINRRAMLETMAGLLTLGGMAILFLRPEHVRPGRAVAAGLLLGAAMLTKELAFTGLLAIFAFWFWQRVREPAQAAANRALLLTPLIAILTYMLFPLWAYTTGDWYRFSQVKLLSLSRLLGLVQITGWNRPGVSLWSFLGNRLVDYGSSYFLLGLGGLATLWLLLRRRDEPAGRLLGIWGLILYPFYAFVALFGSGNDQFFYFLLVPAMLLVGYAIFTLPRRGKLLTGGLLLAVLLPFNALLWWQSYGVGEDDAYHQLATYVEANVPASEAINATGDEIKFEYFFPNRPISDAEDPDEAVETGTSYFALAPKDVWARFQTTPELASWIEANGERVFAASGDSYGDLYLYRVENPGTAPATLPAERTFPPADTAFVGTLVAGLMLWLGLVTGLAVWLERRRDDEPVTVRRIEGEPERARAYRT